MEQWWFTLSAGILLVGLSLFIFSLSGIAALFNIRVRVPVIVGWIVFLLGVAVILHAFGFWNYIYKLTLTTAFSLNLIEVVVGFIFLILPLVINIQGLKPRLLQLLGLLLILDGSGILPILTGLKVYISSLAYYVGLLAIHNPVMVVLWIVGVVVVVLLVLWFMKKLGILEVRSSE